MKNQAKHSSLSFFETLKLEEYSLVWGDSVRSFFTDDLAAIEKGICFLPEWICQSMSYTALSSSHQLIFYPVRPFTASIAPLETDWENLIFLLEKQRKFEKNIIILIAFPFGYIDQGTHIFYNYIRKIKNKKISVFLDLAQSYGYYNFLPDLDFVRSIYFSFNGNKLLNTGGALSISKKKRKSNCLSNEEITTLITKIEDALVIQKKLYCKMKQEINTLFSLHIDSFYQNQTRSNYHRTALYASRPLWNNLLKTLEEQGYGQPINPDPQKNLILPSKAYLQWYKEIFLLFPFQRKVT